MKVCRVALAMAILGVPVHGQGVTYSGEMRAWIPASDVFGKNGDLRAECAVPANYDSGRPVLYQPVVEVRVAPRAVRRPSGKAQRGSSSGQLRPRSNNAGRDGWPLECSATFTTGC